jgi:hypothetical protein
MTPMTLVPPSPLTTRTTTVPVRALRRVPPPAIEPAAVPFDGAVPPTLRQPALVVAESSSVGARRPAPLAVVAREGCAPPPTPRSSLPDARVWTRRLVTGVLEVQAGIRPPVQLARYLDERVFAALRRSQRAGSGQGSGRLRSVRISEPNDGVVEATAIIERAGRCSAVALRLEGIDGRWVCTVFEALVPQRAAASVRTAS